MKGDFNLFVLQMIKTGADTVSDISDFLIYHSKSNWYKRFRGLPIRFPERWFGKKIQKKIDEIALKQKIHKVIYNLKRSGLISDKISNKYNCGWDLSRAGISKIEKVVSDERKKMKYRTTDSDEFKIIMFDVPESKRFYRHWLRSVLKNIGFKMLQKSVWMGKKAIPQIFINDLVDREILDHIEILAVTKRGTLKQLV